VANGRLVRSVAAGGHVVAEVALDLPDKSAVKVAAACGTAAGRIPAPLPVRFALSGPTELVFSQVRHPSGLQFFTSKQKLTLAMENVSRQPVELQLQVKLDGQQLILQPPTTAPSAKKPPDHKPGIITLAAGQKHNRRIALNLLRLDPGKHSLQVYVLNDPLKRVTAFPLQIAMDSQRPQQP